jgi:hypothetical protein
VLPGPLVGAAPRCPAHSCSLPHPATATGPPRRRAPLVIRRAHVTRAHRLPCSQRARHPLLSERLGAAAPVPCRLMRCRTSAAPSPLLSCPHTAPSQPPSFFPRRSMPENIQKRRLPSCSPLRSASLHPCSSTSPLSLSTLDSVRRPQTTGSPRSPVRF